MSSFTPFLLSPGLSLHYNNCYTVITLNGCLFSAHMVMWFKFVKPYNLYYIQQPRQLESVAIGHDQLDATEQNADLDPE